MRPSMSTAPRIYCGFITLLNRPLSLMSSTLGTLTSTLLTSTARIVPPASTLRSTVRLPNDFHKGFSSGIIFPASESEIFDVIFASTRALSSPLSADASSHASMPNSESAVARRNCSTLIFLSSMVTIPDVDATLSPQRSRAVNAVSGRRIIEPRLYRLSTAMLMLSSCM